MCCGSRMASWVCGPTESIIDWSQDLIDPRPPCICGISSNATCILDEHVKFKHAGGAPFIRFIGVHTPLSWLLQQRILTHQPTVRCFMSTSCTVRPRFLSLEPIIRKQCKAFANCDTLVASMLTRHLVFVCWVWLCRTSCAQQVRKTIFGFLNLFLPSFDCFLSLGAELRKRRPVLRKPVPNHLIAWLLLDVSLFSAKLLNFSYLFVAVVLFPLEWTKLKGTSRSE